MVVFINPKIFTYRRRKKEDTDGTPAVNTIPRAVISNWEPREALKVLLKRGDTEGAVTG